MPDNSSDSFRLITRSDFDGIVCSAIFKEKINVSEILFAHPKDMQEGLIKVHSNDISANLPYVPGIYRAFDHHHSETERLSAIPDNYIIDPKALSASRVVYEYYGGDEAFKDTFHDMVAAVDKGDSAQFTREEVLHPEQWVLLNFIMDSRTGLGRFKNFRISNYQLMMDLTDYCRTQSIDEILSIEDVRERKELYFEHREPFNEQIHKCTTLHDNVLVTDIRPLETIYAGNRFVKYALFPSANVSIQVLWGYKRDKTVFTVGKSIFNKTSKHDIGSIMLSYEGGGHENAGTCQIPNDQAETVLKELIAKFQQKN